MPHILTQVCTFSPVKYCNNIEIEQLTISKIHNFILKSSIKAVVCGLLKKPHKVHCSGTGTCSVWRLEVGGGCAGMICCEVHFQAELPT